MTFCCCFRFSSDPGETIPLREKTPPLVGWQLLEWKTLQYFRQLETARICASSWLTSCINNRSYGIEWLPQGIVTSGYPKENIAEWVAQHDFVIVDLTSLMESRPLNRKYLSVKDQSFMRRFLTSPEGAQGIHHPTWKDGAMLTPAHLDRMVLFVKTACSSSVQGLWVHCKEGNKRTGIFVTALYLSQQIRAGVIHESNLKERLVELIRTLRAEQKIVNFVSSENCFDSLLRYGEFLIGKGR